MLGGVFGPEPCKYATWLLVSTHHSRNTPLIGSKSAFVRPMTIELLGVARWFPPHRSQPTSGRSSSD